MQCGLRTVHGQVRNPATDISPRHQPTATHLAVRVSTTDGQALPWSTLVASVAAHFNCNVQIARPQSAFITAAYLNVPVTNFNVTANGRQTWDIPMGLGAHLHLETRRRDGRPFTVNTPTTASFSEIQKAFSSTNGTLAPPPKRPKVGAHSPPSVTFRPNPSSPSDPISSTQPQLSAG